MDPEKVKLTTRQKIKPLLKAINEEIPLQIIIMTISALTALFIVPSFVPTIVPSSPNLDWFLRYIVIGAVSAIAVAIVSVVAFSMIEELTMQVRMLIKRIQENYEKESLTVKKKILDEVIDKEVLK